MHPGLLAFILGVGSAASFPIGAILGLYITLSPRVLASLLAFGAGSLLFALSIELFAPSLFEEHGEHGSNRDAAVYSTFVAGIIGALLFVFLNSFLSTDHGPETKKHPRTRVYTHSQQAPLFDGPQPSGFEDQEHLNVPDNHGEFQVGSLSNRNSVIYNSLTVANTFLQKQLGGKVAMSMWLGVMLDGIPESMVFGFLANEGKYSLALVFGVFVSNFPEAVTAASMMKEAGKSSLTVFCMWSSLVILTGAGAYITTLIFDKEVPGETNMAKLIVTNGSQGLAGGAMLAMVSATMLPEAFHKGGGNVVSLMTVSGFLAAFLLNAVTEE